MSYMFCFRPGPSTEPVVQNFGVVRRSEEQPANLVTNRTKVVDVHYQNVADDGWII